ncbi:fluoride efflux transporter FluC [Lysobacter korlensis]|uniref:Fluoride-specific ion channel FluC n=1 Tax=Lysobacter korlensis TaxID=553636 RepID=A0ABV6RU25_9GAMM
MIPAVFGAAVLAGGLAAVARYLVTRSVGPTPFPWAVLLVNVMGSAMGGAALGMVQAGALPAEWELVVLGGVAGGLTTFSTLAVGTVQIAQAGRRWWAVGNVLGSLVLGIAAVCAGWMAVALFA